MTSVVEPATGYYVYGVVRARSLPVELRGLDDLPIELVEGEDGIAAAVSPIALDRPPGRRAELVAHGRVVDRLAECLTVVPAQFGSVMLDRESVLHELLHREHRRFVALLMRLEGRCQMVLRASYRHDQVLAEIAAERPDIAELHRRTRDLPAGAVHPDLVRLGELVSRALDDKRAVDTPQILAALEARSEAQAVRSGAGLDALLDVAVLLPRDDVAELEAGLEDLAEAVHERIRLRLTGPTAAYDFVGEAAWA